LKQKEKMKEMKKNLDREGLEFLDNETDLANPMTSE